MQKQPLRRVTRSVRDSSSLPTTAEYEEGPAYPYALTFYRVPPANAGISLDEFETWALDRLQVLKSIEAAMVRNKFSGDVFEKSLEETVNTYLPLSTNYKKGGGLELERKKDHVSHYILRLAYCGTEELRRWFTTMEAALFRMRFKAEPPADRQKFVESLNLNHKPISESQKQEMKDELLAASPFLKLNFETELFYEIDFEKIPDLVAKRAVYLRKGKAYFAASELIGFIVNEFKMHLMRALEITAKALPRMDEDERLVPVLNNMSKQMTGREYTARPATAGEVNADTVDSLVSHFPLCMRNLHDQLQKDGHLRHGGRLQYGLFLKGIGLPLDEALIFWKRMFTRTTDDKFRKEYAYNIRHNYGMEGKRTNYTPFSCDKIIRSNQPGPGDHHGCPYRHFSPEVLRVKLLGSGISESGTREILDLSRNMHYNIACTRFLELTRPKPASDTGNYGAAPLDAITHPNQYFDQSYRGAAADRRNPDTGAGQ